MTETNMNECMFCLKIVCDDKFVIINEGASQMLNALLLKVNLDRDKESVMCLECATKLQNAMDFKTTCLNARSKMSALNDFESNAKLLSKEENRKKNTCLKLTDILEDKKCEFCMRPTESGSCISLWDVKESVYMIDMVQKHIPELHLNITEGLVTCETCLSSLQNLLNFATIYSETEGKTKDIDRKAVHDLLKLNDNKDFSLKHKNVTELEENYNKNVEDITMKREEGCEDQIEINNLNVHIKSEEIEFKLEEDNCKSAISNCEGKCLHQEIIKDDLEERTLSKRKMLKGKTYQCERCTFETDHKPCLIIHWSTHQHHPKGTLYNCEICSFKTRSEYNLKNHVAFHQNLPDETFHCGNCTFKTKIKKSLKSHWLTHQDSSIQTLFTCKQCSYATKNKHSLKKHQETH